MSAAEELVTGGLWSFPCTDPKCEPAKSRPYSRDKQYPSATTLTGLLDKPGLSWAAAKETAVYFYNHANELLAMPYLDAVDKGRKHHRVLWDNAANLGTLTHQAAEAFARGEAFEPPADMHDEDYQQLSNFIAGLTAWWEKVQPEVLATEMIVRHDNPNFIGTLDMLAVVDGVVVVVDFKNTKKLDGDPYLSDWGRQLGAYMACDTLCHYHQGKLAATLPWTDDLLARPEAGLIVNIMGDGSVREFQFPRDDEVALAQMAALANIKAYKPVAVQVRQPELLVIEPRPEAPVSVAAFLD